MEVISVTVVKQPRRRGARITLKNLARKDAGYRKISRKLDFDLPPEGTVLALPATLNTRAQLKSLKANVRVSRVRTFAAFLDYSTAASKAPGRRQRLTELFEEASRPLMESLQEVGETCLLGQAEGNLGISEEVITVRPIRSLGIALVSLPMKYLFDGEQRISSSSNSYFSVGGELLSACRPKQYRSVKEDGAESSQLHDVKQSSSGKSPLVGIVDTGIDLEVPELSDLDVSFVEIDEQGNRVPGDARDLDGYRHGTRVAQIISQTASRKVRLAVAAAVPEYRTDFLRISTAMEWLSYEQEADIINMSLVTTSKTWFKRKTIYSELFRRIVQHAFSEDIPLVGATGNYGEGNVGCPAAYKECLSVGALEESGAFWVQSGHGYVAEEEGTYNPYAVLNGSFGDSLATSFAAAQLTGLLARHSITSLEEARASLNGRLAGSSLLIGRGRHQGETCSIS